MEGQWPKQHGGNLDLDHALDQEQWQQHASDDLDLAIGSDDSGMDLLWGQNHGGVGDHEMDGLLGAAADANTMGNSDEAADGAAAATAAASVEEEVNSGGTSHSSGRRMAGVKHKRHSREQIQQLEAVFREVPYPDDNLRKALSKKVGLTDLQIRLWFQNRRSSRKKQVEREEIKMIRGQNKVLQAENEAIKMAIIQRTCRTCGGPTVRIQQTAEQRRLRLDNARLKEELKRASAILSIVTGKASAEVRPVPVPRGLPVGRSSAIFSDTAVTPFLPPPPPCALADPMLVAPEECVSKGFSTRGNLGRAALQRHVQRAMDEFRSLVSKGKPMWLPTRDGDMLNYEEYSKATFPGIFGSCRMGFAVDGTRESGMVMGTAGDLAGVFMDLDSWSEMFPGLVAGATARNLSIASVSRHGQIQLVEAELRVLAPRVPVRKMKFIRQCEMLEPGVWAVVDVSIDGVSIPGEDGSNTSELHERNSSCRLMPSGCLIEDVKNGYSKVTWIVIMEYDETTAPPLYHPLIRSGKALGARRWLAALKRQCEYLVVLRSDPTRTLGNTGGIPLEGRNNILQLAQSMVASFYAGMSGPRGQTWRSLEEWRGGHGAGSDRVELAVRFVTSSRAAPGEQQALVLTATTTVWLPNMPSHVVFDYLCDMESRGEWDTLANGASVQEERYVATGQLHGNAVSVLRPNASDGTGNDKLILQETRVDKLCKLLAYAPIGEQSMVEVMNSCGDASVLLQPSGFVVLPDGHCSELLVPHSAAQHAANSHASQSHAAGSFVSAMYQTVLSGSPPECIATETIDHIGKMLCRAMKKIKDAVRANIVLAA